MSVYVKVHVCNRNENLTFLCFVDINHFVTFMTYVTKLFHLCDAMIVSEGGREIQREDLEMTERLSRGHYF